MSSDDERWVMMAVLDHLYKASQREGANSESIQEAIFAISNAYTLNMHSASTKQRYPLDGLSLPDVFKAGREALLNSRSNSAEDATTNEEPNHGQHADQGFERFIQRLRDATAFFNGVDEGTPEYDQRLKHARKKYDARLASKKQRVDRSTDAPTSAPKSTTGSASAPASSPASTSVPTSASEAAPGPENVSSTTAEAASTSASASTNADASEDAKKRAVQIKNRGNAQLKAKQYEAAVQSYSECIELDGANAVYYSNRAAANILLSRFTDAVDDCKKAIALDATFIRPRERLASAYRYLGMTRNEVDALRDALNVQPSNEALQAQMQDAEARLSRDDSSRSNAGNQGFEANMINMMARSMGVPDGLAQTFANSDILSQVGSMVRDNPAMVEQMMRMMGPGTNGSANRGSG